jgi:hypothetical protein
MAILSGRTFARCVTVVALFVAPATAAGQSLESLYQRYRTDEQHADYILFLDRSGSMREPLVPGRALSRHEAARSVARLIVETARPGDYVAIVGFESDALLLSPGRVLGRDVSDILADIASWPPPSGLQTDIGKALSETVRQLNRSGANPIQFLFFLTDGRHDPPPGSAFADMSGPAWRGLADQARNATAGRIVRVTGMALADVADVDLVRRAWPEATVLPRQQESLLSFFTQVREQARRLKLAAQIETDLARPPIRIQTATDTIHARAGGESAVALDGVLGVSRIAFAVTEGHVEVDVGGKVVDWRFKPAGLASSGARAEVGTATLRFEAGSLLRDVVASFLGKGRRDSLVLQVSTSGYAGPRDLLRNVLLKDPQWYARQRVVVPVVLMSRIPRVAPWSVVICLLVLAGRVIVCRRRRRLRGSILVWPESARVTDAQRIDLGRAGREVVLLRQAVDRGYSITGDGRPIVVFRAVGCAGRIEVVVVAPDVGCRIVVPPSTEPKNRVTLSGAGEFHAGGFCFRYSR